MASSLRERFLDLLEDIPVGLFVSLPDGTISAANRALANILKCPDRETLLRCKATDFYYNPKDREVFLERLRKEGEVQAFEVKFRCFNGEIIYVALSAKLYREEDQEILSGIIQDLTPLRRALDLLSQSEEKFRIVMETAPEAILGIDAEREIVFVNPSAERLFAYEEGELIGRRWEELLVGDSSLPEASSPLEVEMKKATGETFPAEVIFSPPILLEKEKLSFAFIRDISLRKELEKRLIEEEKTRVLKLMARGFIHDFNNLFQLLKGQLELAKLKPENASQILERIRQISLQLESLLDQLAIYAGHKSTKPQPVALVSLIKRVVSLVLHGSDIKLKISAPDEDIFVLGDETQLFQVFQNLALNAREALEASNEAGEIEIEIRKVKISPEMGLELPAGDYVEILFRDNGPGIPEDLLPRVFEPYFSTKPGGSGLGLALVQSIIKNHGGLVRAESKKGAYTLFRLYLPLLSSTKKH